VGARARIWRVDDVFVHAPATGARGGAAAPERGGKSVDCSGAGDCRCAGPFRPRPLLSWCRLDGESPIAQSGRAGKGCFEDVDVDVKVRADEEEVEEDYATVRKTMMQIDRGSPTTVEEASSPGVRLPALPLPTLDAPDSLRAFTLSRGPTTSLLL
jgi:hypothetical protein